MRRLLVLLVLTNLSLAQDGLQARLQAIAAERPGMHLHVETLDGRELADYQGDIGALPASNVKLITATLALETLGSEYELRTSLHRNGRLRGGRIDGDLVVRGGGDPTISSRFRGDGAGGLLHEWARQLAGMGVRGVSGDLVLDTRLFDPVYRHPSWPRDQWKDWWSAGVSALNVGDGCLEVRVSAGSGGAAVEIDPPLLDYEMLVDCPLTDTRSEHMLDIQLDADARRVTVRGKFWRQAGTFTHFVAVPDPSLFFGEALRAALSEAGIPVQGQLRFATPLEGLDTLPLLAAHTTPLRVALGTMLKRSQNLYAESLFKLAGQASGHGGSYEGGAAASLELMEKLGLSMQIADGSGFSRENLIKPRDMVGLLRWVSQRSYADDFYSFLPVSGIDGTLKKRLTGVAKGRVLAKTGTLNGVTALSGFAIVGSETLVFSILVSNPRLGTGAARQWLDRAVQAFFEE